MLLVYTKFGCIYYQSMNHWYIDAYEEKSFLCWRGFVSTDQCGGITAPEYMHYTIHLTNINIYIYICHEQRSVKAV